MGILYILAIRTQPVPGPWSLLEDLRRRCNEAEQSSAPGFVPSHKVRVEE